MALTSSGTISFGDINIELTNPRTNQLSIGSAPARDLAGIASGTIKLSDFYGKSLSSGSSGLFSVLGIPGVGVYDAIGTITNIVASNSSNPNDLSGILAI
jgi:hypothetical protein